MRANRTLDESAVALRRECNTAAVAAATSVNLPVAASAMVGDAGAWILPRINMDGVGPLVRCAADSITEYASRCAQTCSLSLSLSGSLSA